MGVTLGASERGGGERSHPSDPSRGLASCERGELSFWAYGDVRTDLVRLSCHLAALPPPPFASPPPPPPPPAPFDTATAPKPGSASRDPSSIALIAPGAAAAAVSPLGAPVSTAPTLLVVLGAVGLLAVGLLAVRRIVGEELWHAQTLCPLG